MGYYDNVKENVKNQAQDSSSGSSSGGGNFDTLKEAATETAETEDEDGDDTPIEVLEEDGLSRQPQKKNENRQKSGKTKRTSGNVESSGNPLKSSSGSGSSGSSGAGSSADLSRVEEKMDTIIEQNQEMIDILRSFAE